MAVTKNTVVIKLDIRLDADKRTVSAILFDNGYTVRKTTIKAGNRNKTVLEAYKEEEMYAKGNYAEHAPEMGCKNRP